MSVDAHYTPVRLGVAILRAFAPYLSTPSRVWEPCVGGEALAEAVREVWPEAYVIGSDLDKTGARGLCHERHKADCRAHSVQGVDLVVTNPPFSTKGGAFDMSHSVLRALVAHAEPTKTPTLILAPAAWLTSPKHRFGWLRESSTCHLPIGGRVWMGVREMMIYGWHIPGAPYWMPELSWSRSMAEPEWVDSTDPDAVSRCAGGQTSLFGAL